MGPFLKKMETRHLRDTDMKQLVRIFHSIPKDASDSTKARYRRHTKEGIHDLPRRLRASRFSLHVTSLCGLHEDLDDHLTKEIWSWLQHELGGTIGQFLYPVVMCGHLSATEELAARQLEPVSRIWRRDFDQAAATPPDHEPIHRGDKWTYQANKCAACILSRIGSDTDVLYALFGGMVGRLATRTLVDAEAAGDTEPWEKTRSKRIRFVKYWLRVSVKDGDAAVFAAGTLGMKMRRSRREWGEEEQRVQHERQLGPQPRPVDVKRFSPASDLGFNVSTSPTHSVQVRTPPVPPVRHPLHIRHPSVVLPTRPSSVASDGTVRPAHRPARADSTQSLRPAPLQPHPKQTQTQQPPSPLPSTSTPIWDQPGRANPTESEYTDSIRTIWRPATSTPSVSLRTQTQSQSQSQTNNRTTSTSTTSHLSPNPPQVNRPPSLATTRTITSYDGAVSSRYTHTIADPYSAFHNLPEGYEVHLDALSSLPRPGRGSMYEAFGDGGWDAVRFEGVDVEGVEWSDDDEDGGGLERVVKGLRVREEEEELF